MCVYVCLSPLCVATCADKFDKNTFTFFFLPLSKLWPSIHNHPALSTMKTEFSIKNAPSDVNELSHSAV